MLYERLRKRAATLSPELVARMYEAFKAIRLSLTTAELSQAIESGLVELLLEDLLSDAKLDPVFAPLRQAIDEAVISAGKSEAANLPKQVQTGAFDVINRRVLEAAVKLDTRVVMDLKKDVRTVVRLYVMDGIREGKNPRDIAKAVRNKIGLSERQIGFVDRFHAELEIGDRAALNRVLGRGVIRTPDGTEIVRRAHADQQGLSGRDLETLQGKLGRAALRPDQIERMVGAYERRLLALNTETVTRTIALDAMRAGARASWEDAIAQGTVNRSDLRRTWVAVDDNRTRPEHRALNGTTVEWDAPYPNGELVPGESTYNCRCIERITIAREALAA
jgi:hypothetical protein